jgi:hypothetical protein
MKKSTKGSNQQDPIPKKYPSLRTIQEKKKFRVKITMVVEYRVNKRFKEKLRHRGREK